MCRGRGGDRARLSGGLRAEQAGVGSLEVYRAKRLLQCGNLRAEDQETLAFSVPRLSPLHRLWQLCITVREEPGQGKLRCGGSHLRTGEVRDRRGPRTVYPVEPAGVCQIYAED